MKQLRLLLAGLAIFATTATFAQESAGLFSASAGVDLFSRYVWRGTNLGGNAPSVQPYGAVTIADVVEVGAWAAYSTSTGFESISFTDDDGLEASGVGSEFDTYISGGVGPVALTITDYYFPAASGKDKAYGNYDEETTGHTLEAALSYGGVESLPLSALVAYNFWGADKSKALYVELGYPVAEGIDVFVGAGANTVDEETEEIAGVDVTTKYDNSFYGRPGSEGFQVVNVGVTASRNIEAFGGTLPLSLSFVLNPATESVYAFAGVSF